MKKTGLALALVCLSLVGMSQQAAAPQPKKDPLEIAPMHNFGVIQQGRPVTYDFQLTNIGTDTLRIETVGASCGCTTPKWSTEPVLPGQKSIITVGYNAAGEGVFEKSVGITYNGVYTKTIIIKGEVAKAQPPAPANTSVSLLKQIN